MTLHLPDCSDGELAGLALAGRQAAFGELVRRHQGWVYRLVRSHVGDSEEAIDVTQTCFVSAFSALGRYDGKRSFRAWLSRRRIIHLVDDEEAIRRAAGFALKTAGYVVETYASGVEFLKVARSATIGCVILDVRMPEMDGLAVQAAMAERGINMPVVVLTGHGDVSVAVQAMKAGAVDFLEKPFEKAALLQAVTRAFGRIDDADVRAIEATDAQVRIAALTPREREVLEGLANGYPNKTIAYDLGCSSRTVEVHRASVMTKLDVRNLSEALRIAFAAGLGRKP